MVTCLGIPLDENSSFLRGASDAPKHIRDAYNSDSSNYWTEDGINLKDNKNWKDIGDLKLSSMPGAFSEITNEVEKQLNQGNRVLSFGGDHSVTYPVIKAFAKKYSDLNILHIDAHGDLYDDFEGNKLSHACPFARIMEERLAKRLLQIGIRTYNAHQREQVKRFNVEAIEMKDWRDGTPIEFKGPVYISLDLDALDPAFVPGVSHYEPGGFSTRQLLSVIQNLKAEIVGADIVELNPSRDVNSVTAMVAAKLFKEILVKML
ncbi:MAG TPA: agmatinase [Chryseolinea sp.]|nr:agmatinase [Chryseolinea sp.]